MSCFLIFCLVAGRAVRAVRSLGGSLGCWAEAGVLGLPKAGFPHLSPQEASFEGILLISLTKE